MVHLRAADVPEDVGLNRLKLVNEIGRKLKAAGVPLGDQDEKHAKLLIIVGMLPDGSFMVRCSIVERTILERPGPQSFVDAVTWEVAPLYGQMPKENAASLLNGTTMLSVETFVEAWQAANE